MPAGNQPQQLYAKTFLDAVADALVAVASEPPCPSCVILYKRAGKLDVRVRIDLIPPVPPLQTIIVTEP